jgi:hypothetical protein
MSESEVTASRRMGQRSVNYVSGILGETKSLDRCITDRQPRRNIVRLDDPGDHEPDFASHDGTLPALG